METWPANTLVASGRLLPLGTLGERKTDNWIEEKFAQYRVIILVNL